MTFLVSVARGKVWLKGGDLPFIFKALVQTSTPKNRQTNGQLFLCGQHYLRCFISLLFYPNYRLLNWGRLKLNNLFKVTLSPLSGGAQV